MEASRALTIKRSSSWDVCGSCPSVVNLCPIGLLLTGWSSNRAQLFSQKYDPDLRSLTSHWSGPWKHPWAWLMKVSMGLGLRHFLRKLIFNMAHTLDLMVPASKNLTVWAKIYGGHYRGPCRTLPTQSDVWMQGPIKSSACAMLKIFFLKNV